MDFCQQRQYEVVTTVTSRIKYCCTLQYFTVWISQGSWRSVNVSVWIQTSQTDTNNYVGKLYLTNGRCLCLPIAWSVDMYVWLPFQPYIQLTSHLAEMCCCGPKKRQYRVWPLQIYGAYFKAVCYYCQIYTLGREPHFLLHCQTACWVQFALCLQKGTNTTNMAKRSSSVTLICWNDA